jgi:RHH-type transcriptional regulator, proline utilization regulon repressor / proline dehydrogenase / delta 1-pyrroline-5-carboxylate dehydrogenase
MIETDYMSQIRAQIEQVRGKPLTLEKRCQAAIDLAALLLREALHIQTRKEKKHQNDLAQLVQDPLGKTFATTITDQCFRSQDPARTADQLIYFFKSRGIPRSFRRKERLSLLSLKYLGHLFPKFFMSQVKWQIRHQTLGVILPAESIPLSKYLGKRRKEGITVNLNHLGEAILGEEEAQNRLSLYLEDLANPEIDYISVKISSIFSQLNLVDRKKTLDILKQRLRALFRAAQANPIIDGEGCKRAKFVNLDMEEYRDLRLTVDIFKEVLEEEAFNSLSAGIVLQSYLPDSFPLQQELTEWALQRIQMGGASIKIRLVKGANLAMEQVEASLRKWPQAPYSFKREVDANFKRMMIYGCKPEHAQAAHIGIGSHNLFDIAFGLLLRAENQVEKEVCFEMLEGMGGSIRRVIQGLSSEIVLYCPVAAEDELQYAVAYLMRRLDENTAPDNFLRYAFGMIPGSKEWQKQALAFSDSCRSIDQVSSQPNRQQDRFQNPLKPNIYAPFENEADTDWSLPKQREWAEKIYREWYGRSYEQIPLVVAGKSYGEKILKGQGEDPYFAEKALYLYSLAQIEHVDEALNAAKKAFKEWSARSVEERSILLAEIAYQLRIGRADLIGSMMADTGKTIFEADVEVSEAVDFAEYYRRNAEEILGIKDLQWNSKGVVLVAPPWNFPCSIPAGGILAALAAGNSVIFKPAPEAVLVGWTLAQLFWKAGVSKDLLQFLPCADEPIGSLLIKDPRVDCVVLTGSTETAKHLLKMRPGLDLIAETGGKNAMIITAMADRDLAIKDLLQSAFGHAGQKCSACSLVICEGEVYDSPYFRQTLRDAAASLFVGSQWDFSTKINPLIRFPTSTLLRGLTELDEGEEWLLQPKQDPNHPYLWSPGIKLGVKRGSYSHQHEFFGPVLSVMRADNLDHAIDIANGTPYGLTAGLHSLDEREQQKWIEHIEAGNRYINRGITGAIVQRQPFGGWKQSSFGRGYKAGGPNYVMQLMQAKQISLPAEQDNVNALVHELTILLKKEKLTDRIVDWNASVESYAFFWNRYFSKQHDPSKVLGQDNILFYVPVEQQTLRVQAAEEVFDVLRVIAAALTCGAPLEISCSPNQISGLINSEWSKQSSQVILTEETEEQLIERIHKGFINRLRVLHKSSDELALAMSQAGKNLIHAPVLANGRVELLLHLREASLSVDTHRYGNLKDSD